MKSKTKIGKRIGRKKDSSIVETVINAKKHKNWINIASIISGPKRNYRSINLSKIDEKTSEGDTVLVLGSVLGSGDINKKIRISALHFSEQAVEKLKKTKSEIVSILDEIKKNPRMEGVKILP
jgi:large subunit ribosomal protein L18e